MISRGRRQGRAGQCGKPADARQGEDTMIDPRPVLFSGVQPSGNLTIGNYLGAIGRFAEFSEKYKCFYCVVDEHAITVRQVPADLRRRTYETLAL